jgi:hypothetical protein
VPQTGISEFGTFPNPRCLEQRVAARSPARSPRPPQWTQSSYHATVLCPPSFATQHEHDTPSLLSAPAATTAFKPTDWQYTTSSNMLLTTSSKYTSSRRYKGNTITPYRLPTKHIPACLRSTFMQTELQLGEEGMRDTDLQQKMIPTPSSQDDIGSVANTRRISYNRVTLRRRLLAVLFARTRYSARTSSLRTGGRGTGRRTGNIQGPSAQKMD